MSETDTPDIAARIAEESASLPPEKQSAILDFVLFVKERSALAAAVGESEGDAAWERIIADPRPRPKLETYIKASLDEGSEPMDFDRL